MALRILQFSALFAIGYYLGPITLFVRALDSPEIALSLKLIDPQDVIVQRGQSAILKCDVKSSLPGLQVTWLHNDSPIPSNDSKWVLQENGALYIPKIASGKRSNGITGDYQCLVRNRAGALLSNVAKLRVATMEREFSRSPNNLTIVESQPTLLRCGIHSTPPAIIQWEFNNLPLPQHTRYVPLPSGALLILNSHMSDAGSYRCKATNKILNKPKYSKKATVTVSPSWTKAKTPTFLPLDISPNNTIHVGEDLSLYCAVIGWPTPVVQWLNNDSVIIGNSTILQITKATPHHMGTYTCIAYNTVGRISQNFHVEVHKKPYFTVNPLSKSYPAARTVRLDCHASGIPEPRIYWLKDGRPLSFDTRIKKQSTGLVFSHSFTRDSGIYQCVAINSAGRVWTAAQIEINVSHSPSPPENVQCRPFDSTSICLSWRPPSNVSVQAYSVHSFYKAAGMEVSGPEYVTNMTNQLAEGLNSSTNYTFYVRLYSKAASDSSEDVACETGVVGSRNLEVESINTNSVSLKWSEISTDVSCDGIRSYYKVQWRREGHSSVNIERTLAHKFIVTGLASGTDYEFRVISTSYSKDKEIIPWTHYYFAEIENSTNSLEIDDNNGTDTTLLPPEKLEGTPTSPTTIKLTWSDSGKKSKFYTVCYVAVNEKQNCEEGKLQKSFSTKLQITKLKSNTVYEFKVRSHISEGVFGPFSQSIEVHTPADVPSPVLELKYKIINESTVCVRWQAPMHKNGKLQRYIISYTPDRNWPLERWIQVSIPSYQRKSTACWLGNHDTVSSLLGNLNSDKIYTVLVRAVSGVGIGKPAMPIIITTKVHQELDDSKVPDLQHEIQYHQKVGVIVGVVMALICIICCITCILVRRRCLKRRGLARARMAASNNYYPAVAHYASHVGSVQVRLEDPCAADVHETQNLVMEERSSHIPPISPNHLDTKGGDEFPNGHINGSAKPYMNGHLSNGHVHITENPQYYAFDCNGHTDPKKSKRSSMSLRFEEDSNSNVKSSKFYDLYKLFDNSKRSIPSSYHECSPHFDRNMDSNGDTSLNSTQLSCLDDSLGISLVNNHRRISPILGPNG